eukprot:gnl/TRDRNA2_/TRDRNA2_141346_c0_seq1.p1 gnl/TRDRNA2_/TRDRNA2_141346_c0~~gnl/TRDRNA2_/TRDRNA2_141346_c0_seq1.p1  ORF type:complete len:497 (-),score=89.75 gnl/TRDRNA2_/TRDRNA2_141346_c0_seq1:36-1352(-)
MFGEGGMIMDQSRLAVQDYDVRQYYHTEGFSQYIARSEYFGHFTLAIIGANALYIGIESDLNDEDNLSQADIGFQVMDNMFCSFFTLEWLVRLCAFKNKLDCLRDNWFKFDSLLWVMMVLETWVIGMFLTSGLSFGLPTQLFKLLRLLRLARMARLMRALPELVAMIKGVKVASRAVASALLLLIGLLYIFSIILFMLLKETTDDFLSSRFGRLALVMHTLLIDGTFLDNVGLVSRGLLEHEEYPSWVLLMLFVLFSALTVMNMLVGVLCEVVSAVKTAEEENYAIRMVKDHLLEMLQLLDEDQSGMISKDEIQKVLEDNEALEVLTNLRVDVQYLMQHLDMFFEETPDLSIHQIMELILMLRGDRPPTMKDMLHGQTYNRWRLNRALAEQEERMAKRADDVEHMVKQSIDHLASQYDRDSISDLGSEAGKDINDSKK